LKKEQLLRKEYFNQVQVLRGNVCTFARVRPWNDNDGKIAGNRIAIKCSPLGDELVVTEPLGKSNFLGHSKVFEFDHIFSGTSTQQEVFEKGAKDLIASVLDGYNVSILAYGETGSGKTYTMKGKNGTTWKHHQAGLCLRALKEIFRLKAERILDVSYDITLSVLEIYNENIRDLLGPEMLLSEEADLELRLRSSYLKFRYIESDVLVIEDLTTIRCESFEDAVVLMEKAQTSRHVGVTNMNEYSSRSHNIVRITVTGKNRMTHTETLAILNFIDLAGSERVHKSVTNNEEQFREVSSINRSFSALENVIQAIKKKQTQVPYRDSKLTYFLQECLGGGSKVVIFITLSPSLVSVDESLRSLNFGKRVRRTELGRAFRSVKPSSRLMNFKS
jgi:hypothetical protein